MAQLKFRVEHYQQNEYCQLLVRRVIDLAALHWKEMAWTKGREFSPDLDQIANAWRDNAIKLIVAYSNDSPVGYQLWSVSSSLLEKARVDASLFSVYIDNEFRGKGDFKPFLDFGTNAVRAMGARRVVALLDEGSPIESAFARYGWTRVLFAMEQKNV
jgi:hypothetical protein